MTPLTLYHHRSPGDVLMLTAALRDLHKQYPGKYVTDVKTNCMDLFQNNPYITKLSPDDNPTILQLDYQQYTTTAHKYPAHFITVFHRELSRLLQTNIPITEFKADVHLSLEELNSSPIIDKPYWIVNAGGKSDITCKIWAQSRFQEVINYFPDITFIQTGNLKHIHSPLKGSNVIDMLDKTTSYRDFIKLMYHSFGVITGVSFPMHLSAAIPMHPKYAPRRERPCIVIAGGREPVQWEAYPYHNYIHTRGILPCAYDWCLKKRVVKLNDGSPCDRRLCSRPVECNGQVISKCMELITAKDIIQHIERHVYVS
jgi:ADP-heptose:LPS heptosyltransferase